jgi:diguanylate cyclase (GGDEF)-like protein/PAS domain S-box-containing protein
MIQNSNISILYVEDEANIREMLSKFLSRFCTQLYSAENGKAALEIYEEHTPDIVISDIRMPVMDGLKMAKEIKSINPKQLIMFISAHSDSDFLFDAIQLHIDAYLIKPVDLTVLEEELGKLQKILQDRRAAKQLIESEKKFKTITENSEIGIFIYKKYYVFVNDAFCKITGYSRDELYSMQPWKILYAPYQYLAKKTMQKRLAGEEFSKKYQDIKIVCKDNKVKVLRVNTSTVTVENEYAGMGTIIDITDLTQMHEKLSVFEQAIEQMDEMVRITQLDGTLFFVNKAVLKHTGYTEAELIGHSNSIFKSGKHNDEFYSQLWKTILSGEVYQNIFINKKKSGELYYEDQTITPIKDEKTKKIKYFVSTSKDITQQMEMVQKLETLATTDTLTGLYNRYKINQIIDEEIRRAKRYKEPFALLMFDIDHFKKINDTYGHDVGDIVLQEFSQLILSSIRESDKFGRWGGEEFMLVAPNMNEEKLIKFANKLLKLIATHQFEKVGHVTSSIGLSIFKKNDDKSSFLKRVDNALYEAKESGRNRVIFL